MAVAWALAPGWMFETCCNCGIGFAMPDDLYKQRRKDLGWFYCPNGHQQHYIDQSEDQKRIKELERQVAAAKADADNQRRSREWAETRANGANIAAGKAKAKLHRTLTRVHAGVCPHCNRTFKQLAAHMQAKHPGEK